MCDKVLCHHLMLKIALITVAVVGREEVRSTAQLVHNTNWYFALAVQACRHAKTRVIDENPGYS